MPSREANETPRFIPYSSILKGLTEPGATILKFNTASRWIIHIQTHRDNSYNTNYIVSHEKVIADDELAS